jgi:hypothetical protein
MPDCDCGRDLDRERDRDRLRVARDRVPVSVSPAVVSTNESPTIAENTDAPSSDPVWIRRSVSSGERTGFRGMGRPAILDGKYILPPVRGLNTYVVLARRMELCISISAFSSCASFFFASTDTCDRACSSQVGAVMMVSRRLWFCRVSLWNSVFRSKISFVCGSRYFGSFGTCTQLQ